jgi:arylsulfatase A-like enzyme
MQLDIASAAPPVGRGERRLAFRDRQRTTPEKLLRRQGAARRIVAVLCILLAMAVPAAAFERPLPGAGRLSFRDGARPRGVSVKIDPPFSRVPDPRCPTTSSLRLVTSETTYAEIELPCGRWRQTPSGYRYYDRAAGAGGVESVFLSAKKMRIRLRGRQWTQPSGPAELLMAALSIAEQRDCSRFLVSVDQARRVRARKAMQLCRLPRPNFIVVMLDDVRFDAIDRMPILQNEIVAKGVSFDNAFTPNPVCCPSRASTFTGLYSLRHGTHTVGGRIGGADRFHESGADQNTIAVWLNDAGYRTGLFGKYLNDYAQTEENQGPGGGFYIPPGWDRWWAFVSTDHYGGVLGASYQIVEEDGTRTDHVDHSTDAEYSTDLSAEKLRSFIAEAVGAGQPFFAYWSPYAAHGAWPALLPTPALRHAGAFQFLPPWRPPSWSEVDLSDKPLWLQRHAQAFLNAGTTSFYQALSELFRIGQYETLLSVDEQLGMILEQLGALGVDRDTIILFTSDNGLLWGEHQVWFGKDVPYEEAQRVPMVLRYPRRVPEAGNVVAPVLNVDIAPTVGALAGAVLPANLDGQSFAALIVDPPTSGWRKDYLLEHWRVSRRYNLRYSGQMTDGDRLRVFYGDPRAKPRASAIFEFDSGNGTAPGTVPVSIGMNADASAQALRSQILSTIPGAKVTLNVNTDLLVVDVAVASERDSIYLWEELDQGSVLEPENQLPDYFGVRDVANGFTWVEYETGERELYDLQVDPAQLENVAGDPAHAAIRGQLEQRLVELLAEIESR